jgi:hypothetical protein
MKSTTEKKPPPPATERLGDTSEPASTTSAERDEEKGDTLNTAQPSLPDHRDEKAETDVKTVAAASEQPAKRKGKTALIMVAICVRRI